MNKIDKKDMWVLLLSTVRYSMGRMTYMSSLAPEIVFRYKDYLNEYQLKQIKEEVEKEIECHNVMKEEKIQKDWLGMECDVNSWIKFKNDLEELLKRGE